MDCSTTGFPVLHYLLEFAGIHMHWVADAIRLTFYHPLLPGGSNGKESAYSTGFLPWVRKILWRREWLPTPVFLPGEFQGEEPGGLQSMGLQRVGHDWVTNTFTFVNIGVHVSFQIIVLSEHMPKTDIARSYGSSYFEFFEEPSYCFP